MLSSLFLITELACSHIRISVRTMPKVTSSAIQPLSGVFAIDKPSGAITMKLLNSMKELLETSPYFAVPDDPNQRYGHKKRRRGWGKISGRGRAVGVVKLGQGGTLDPLASGVLGESPATSLSAAASS